MVAEFITDATRYFPLLARQNREFEETVILAENRLQAEWTGSPLWDLAGASTFPPDSTQFLLVQQLVYITTYDCA